MRSARRRETARYFALLAAILAASCQGIAATEQYPKIAALEQYLMPDSGAEIAMARSAAPETLARDAEILVLGADGYRTAVKGKSGFTCLVERSWMASFDSPEFWNPKIRGPICYNPAAVRTVLPYTLERTKLLLSGLSKARVHEILAAKTAKKELAAPEVGAMSFMLSKMGYLSDSAGHWHPHLMFYVPKADESNWGANLPGSPILFNGTFRDMPEPEMVLLVPVAHWSDGSPEQHTASH